MHRGTFVPFEVTVLYNLTSVPEGFVGAELGDGTGRAVIIGDKVKVEQGSGTTTIHGSIDVDWLYEWMQVDTVYLALELGYWEDPTHFIVLIWKHMPDYPYFIAEPIPELNLLKKYAPVLYLHPDEQFYPWGIESMLDKAELWKETVNLLVTSPTLAHSYDKVLDTVSREDLDQYNSTYTDILETLFYLNLKGYTPYSNVPPKQAWEGDPLKLYGRYYEPPDHPNKIVLQYWFFYPFNDWDNGVPEFNWNDHEGDWEMIQVILDNATKQATELSSSHHLSGSHYNWDEVSKVAETHPRIFVGKGGHGGWATSGEHEVQKVWRKINTPSFFKRYTLKDLTSENGVALYPKSVIPSSIPGGTKGKKSYELIDISGEPSWVNWVGWWGDREPQLPGSKGPPSPGLQQKWKDPMEWLKKLKSWINGWLGSPGHLHAYDSYGNHVGFTETGEVEATIPGTYLYIPSSYTETSEELIWIYTSEDIRFVIEATGPGSFDFTFSRYLEEEDQLIGLGYKDIEVTEDTIAIVDVSPDNPGFVMEIDLDGDGIVDEIRAPDVIEGVSILDSVIVYPNPYYLNKGQVVKITPLPSGSKVYIYTIAGELVKTLEEHSAMVTWDGRNEAGQTVSRGIYIYLITTSGEKKTGKIAIIK